MSANKIVLLIVLLVILVSTIIAIPPSKKYYVYDTHPTLNFTLASDSFKGLRDCELCNPYHRDIFSIFQVGDYDDFVFELNGEEITFKQYRIFITNIIGDPVTFIYVVEIPDSFVRKNPELFNQNP
jgi:hypothetical protein